jgi:hypothetical protein
MSSWRWSVEGRVRKRKGKEGRKEGWKEGRKEGRKGRRRTSSAVTDTNRFLATVTVEVRKLKLGDVLLAVNGVPAPQKKGGRKEGKER